MRRLWVTNDFTENYFSVYWMAYIGTCSWKDRKCVFLLHALPTLSAECLIVFKVLKKFEEGISTFKEIEHNSKTFTDVINI